MGPRHRQRLLEWRPLQRRMGRYRNWYLIRELVAGVHSMQGKSTDSALHRMDTSSGGWPSLRRFEWTRSTVYDNEGAPPKSVLLGWMLCNLHPHGILNRSRLGHNAHSDCISTTPFLFFLLPKLGILLVTFVSCQCSFCVTSLLPCE